MRRPATHKAPVSLAALQIADRTGDVVDLAIAEAGWITQTGPRHLMTVDHVGWARWRWSLTDTAEHPAKELASGIARTKARGERKAHRAHLAEIDRINAERTKGAES